MTWARSDHLARLGDATVDVAVIGGGIVGGGVALDLAARGAGVALVERVDFAAGTSGKSTKLIHGGIRYLPQLRFGLVREGLREQRVLAETAGYLMRPLDFVIPLYRGVSFGDLPRLLGQHRVIPTALRAGLLLYDLMGRRTQRHRRVDAATAGELAPCLLANGLEGAFVYQDTQTEDARLTIGIIKAAADRGAVAVNHAEVVAVAGHDAGYRLEVRDHLSETTLHLTARAVVSTAGAAVTPTPPSVEPISLRYSRGSHLILQAADVGLAAAAVVLPETEDRRIMYMLPWLGHALVGTTDVASDGDGGHPTASAEEIEYLVRHVARFTGTRPHPMTTFAGTRALAPARGPTARASRQHVIRRLAPGFIQVAGGKLTGYRIIAAAAADAAARTIGLDRSSTTDSVPIAGAGGAGAGRLWERYGALGADVEALMASAPAPAGTSLPDGSVAAEVAYTVRHEAAATLGDFALRRTRLSWLTPDHGRAAAARLAQLMGDELGWDAVRRAAEVDRFEAELIREGL